MRAALVPVLALGLVLGGCAQQASPTPPPVKVPMVSPATSAPHPASSPGAHKQLLVLAASSLSAVIKDINAAYETAHPGVKVDVSLDGSQKLRAQIESGAPADVFISASEDHSQALFAAKLVREPEVFVKNQLALAVSPKSGKVKAFEDLINSEVSLVVCGKDVPAGKYAEKALKAYAEAGHEADVATIRKRVVSTESSVENATTKVQLGEADAGFVYQTDLQRAKLPGVDLPKEMQVKATYTKCILTTAPLAAEAESYLKFLAGPEAKAALEAAGFTMP